MDNQRNLILAVLLSAVVLFGWDFAVGKLYPEPAQVSQSDALASAPASNAAPGEKGKSARHTREGGLTNPSDIAEEAKDLTTALASTDRIKIDAPEVAGSINPVGARLDDVLLKTHRQTVDKDSGPVRLFSPAGTPAQQFAQFGWIGEGVKLPGANTVWTADGKLLTHEKPVTLSWDNGEGQTFRLLFSIDDHYMLDVQQVVVNRGTGSIVIQPYSFINRTSLTASQDTWNVHSGPIAAFDDAVNFSNNYDDVVDGGTVSVPGETEWIGFTDIYWLSALIPQEGASTRSDFRSLGNDKFRADVIYDPVTVNPGKQFKRDTQLFVGAKESDVLDSYQDQGISNFGLAIDWGWFRWFERPIFLLLKKIYSLVGNFGVAIILLTVIIRGLMFPVAQRQFKSMASMRAVQPKMKVIQERYKDDKQKQQQEIMKLYKEEGVNPLAGCLPLVLQIPIFFALYKTLLLAIEMRHKPFVLWIHDLSAPDPATILNLFGLLPFSPPSFLAIGVLALLLGITMFLQFKLNPSAQDPVQQQMFMIMPWVLMFVMAPFAAGLLLYWITSNCLTLAQQRYLYSKHPQLKAQAESAKAKD